MTDPRKRKNEVVCLCNGVSRAVIETAIRNGSTSINEIFDRTTAGVGACGGSCRPYLIRMLESFQQSGEFPAQVRPRRIKPR